MMSPLYSAPLSKTVALGDKNEYIEHGKDKLLFYLLKILLHSERDSE